MKLKPKINKINTVSSIRQIILDTIESAVANVQKHEEEINDLNVFPIPDGDTGSNITSTLVSGWNNIKDSSQTDIEILNDFSKGALLGARGNSGVIISQIIKGIAVGAKEIGGFTSKTSDLRIILRRSKEYSYKSVSNPVEGTILSVVKAMDKDYNRKTKSLLTALEGLLIIAKKATDKTPDQLAILKDAGVVDSGAYGLLKFIEGAVLYFKGQGIKITAKGSKSNNKNVQTFQKADPTKNIGYCTEFILSLKNPKKFDKEYFKKELEKLGDSIVMIVEEDILKVHIHVSHPGVVFNFAQKYGEFSNIKSENMAMQAEDVGHNVEGNEFKIKKSNDKELAIIAVSTGSGLDEKFINLGVNSIISGGQSMNPSVENFLEEISKLSNKSIVILPNNSNIILTAQAVKKIVKDKNIFVLPTKSIAQGIVATYNINKEMEKFEDFFDYVCEQFKVIEEGQIAKAVKNSTMNNIKVKIGDYIAVKNKKIINSSKKSIDAAKSLIDLILKNKSVEEISVIYNDLVTQEDRKNIEVWFKKQHKDIDLEMNYGGQKVFDYIIFGEVFNE